MSTSGLMEENMREAKEKIDLLLDLFEVDLLNLDNLLAANETEEENNLTTVVDLDFDFLQARTLIEEVETGLDIL